MKKKHKVKIIWFFILFINFSHLITLYIYPIIIGEKDGKCYFISYFQSM